MHRLRQRLWPDHRHRKQQFAGVTVGHAPAAVRRKIHILTNKKTTPQTDGEPSRAPRFLCSNRSYISGRSRMVKIPSILLFSVTILAAAAAPARQSSPPQSSRPTSPPENNSSPASGAFEQPRRLFQQGKYDPALAARKNIDAQPPVTTRPTPAPPI